MKTVLVTGANGFIGRALCHSLNQLGINVHATIRAMTPDRVVENTQLFAVGELNSTTDWQAALQGVDTLFHLAATVHQPKNHDAQIYSRTIVDATRRLVEQSIDAGVKRFVYISTTKVYGKETSPHRIQETDPCHPEDLYGATKLAAERVLQDLTQNSALEWVIIRPAMVYGPNSKGNFQRLANLIRQFPLIPLGSATAPRSLIAVQNLVHFMIQCGNKPTANQHIFNITDGSDVSTAALCQLIAQNLKKKRWFIPIPIILLTPVLRLLGQTSLTDKLFGRLCYDISHAQQQLQWQPIMSTDSAIQAALES